MADTYILTRNSNFIEEQIDYLSTEPIPEIPDEPLRSNAPVTRVLWQCDNLPAGVTLSDDGKLSGRPTATGSYACLVRVTTNWGTATKTINIRVTE